MLPKYILLHTNLNQNTDEVISVIHTISYGKSSNPPSIVFVKSKVRDLEDANTQY